MSKKLIGGLSVFISLWVLFQISSLPRSPLDFIQSWDRTCLGEADMASKIRDSITFLPLKDHRYADKPKQGHTWFMSSLNDSEEKEGESQYLKLPSETSKGRVLCLKGRNSKDGLWNSYALAWSDNLPHNSVLMKGLTFISYDHFTYRNIWHGMTAVEPFVGWFINNQCRLPERWILYIKGELKTSINSWVKTLMEATFDGHFKIEDFEGVYENKSTTYGYSQDEDDASACFEEALVMRHKAGRLSIEKRIKTYDLIRCKARMYCNVTSKGKFGSDIGMTLLMRNGSRSFKNSSAVISIFREACQRVEGCNMMVAYSDNLTIRDATRCPAHQHDPNGQEQ